MIAANVAAAETLEQAALALHVPRPRPARTRSSSRRSAQLLQPARPGARPRRSRAARGPRPAARAAARRMRCAPLISHAGAARPEPGGLQPAQHRPLRPQPRALRPLHLADPALRRPAGAPRADRGAAAGRGRARRTPATTGTSSAPGCRAASAGRWRPSAARARASSRCCSPSAIGSAFDATVAGVQRFGLFVQLTETLAEGLVPVAVARRRVLRPRPRPACADRPEQRHRAGARRPASGSSWSRSTTLRAS